MWRPSSRVDPGRRGARQADVEQPFAARAEAAFAQFAGLVPPAALVPRVGGQGKQFARWRHRREIERHAGAMQIERGFEEAFVLALAAGGGGDRRPSGPRAARHSWIEMDERGMRADFQPHIHAEVGERIDRRDKLHGLPDAAAPVGGGAVVPGAALAGHGAEERNGLRLRRRGRRVRLVSASAAGCISA